MVRSNLVYERGVHLGERAQTVRPPHPPPEPVVGTGQQQIGHVGATAIAAKAREHPELVGNRPATTFTMARRRARDSRNIARK
jgi:hypothetical protein